MRKRKLVMRLAEYVSKLEMDIERHKSHLISANGTKNLSLQERLEELQYAKIVFYDTFPEYKSAIEKILEERNSNSQAQESRTDTKISQTRENREDVNLPKTKEDAFAGIAVLHRHGYLERKKSYW